MYFDKEVANKLGVNGAIMFENIKWWIEKNKANNTHCYDGKWWTYNSSRAFSEMFSFWSQKQIQRILKKLVDEQRLEVGNYNKTPYDRTLWYAIGQKCPFKETYMNIQGDETDQPIPDINTDVNTTTYLSHSDESDTEEAEKKLSTAQEAERLYKLYTGKFPSGKKRHKRATSLERIKASLNKHSPLAVEQAIENYFLEREAALKNGERGYIKSCENFFGYVPGTRLKFIEDYITLEDVFIVTAEKLACVTELELRESVKDAGGFMKWRAKWREEVVKLKEKDEKSFDKFVKMYKMLESESLFNNNQ